MLFHKRGAVVIGLFFCSGATALVYEVVWSKYLAQMFGSTIYAQTVVLAAFMGGLALGNRVFGRWADKLQQPLKAYGYFEIAIGIYACIFPWLDTAAERVFVSVGSGIVAHSFWLLLLKGILSVGLLLGPTILMGGTLPVLAAWLQKFSADASRRSARFYSINSLGAVFGSALAGFWLVQQYGMVSSLQITALANAIVGLLAIALSRGEQVEPATTAASAGEPWPKSELLRRGGLIVAMTGGISMGLEVLSSRSLALIFGSSLQSFAAVLIAFILGIGLGSAWIASPRRSGKANDRIVVVLLCMAAVWVTFLVFNIERWVDFYRMARIGLGRNPTGYFYHQLLTTGIALVVLGLPAACIGAVLPVVIRTLSSDNAPLGARVGSLLTWNTIGAVVGTLVTGFVLMPVVGLRNAYGVLAFLLGAVALWAAWQRGWRPGMAAAAGACIFAGCLFAFGSEGWRQVMSSGVFRAREEQFDPTTMPARKKHMQIVFYEDAADATVSVERGDGIGAPADLGLRVNGKPDASTRVDLCTQLLVAHLPMLARPGAKDVFVLGLGSGISGGALLAHPAENIVIAENCEPVIRAAHFFENWNRKVLSNPRVHLWNEDARTVLKLQPQLYDVIITQPSNPWTVGIGSVFSREYYELAASRLKPGGVVAQWFHVYEMHDGIVGLVIRTFSSVFPFVEIWDTGPGDIVMVGSLQPWKSGPEMVQHGFALPDVRADLESIDIHSPVALMSRQLASQRTGFAVVGDGPIQSDAFPVLEYAAPEAFYIGARSQMLSAFDERTRQNLLAPPAKRAALREMELADVRAVFSRHPSMNDDMFTIVRTPEAFAAVGTFGTNAISTSQGDAQHFDVVQQAAVALSAGDLNESERLVALGASAAPGDPRIGYLARIIKRERQLRELAAGPRADR